MRRESVRIDPQDVDRGAPVTIRDAEMTLARKLIDELGTNRFEPGKYADEYRARLLQSVEAKVAGQRVTAPPPETRRAQVIDLMDALKQSLAERSQAPDRRPARAKQPAAARPRRSAKK